jgi:hypothetical protein
LPSISFIFADRPASFQRERAADDFGGRADGGEEVEQLRSRRAHRQSAGERLRKLVHAEQRHMPAHRRAGQVNALRRLSSVQLREEIWQQYRIGEALARRIAVAAVARGCPRDAVSNQMLADR